MKVRFSITVRQHPSIRRLIEAIPDDAWSPIPYWLDGGADVAETTYTPFATEKDAAPVRLIVRRVRPTPGSQLVLLVLYDFHAFVQSRPRPVSALTTLLPLRVWREPARAMIRGPRPAHPDPWRWHVGVHRLGPSSQTTVRRLNGRFDRQPTRAADCSVDPGLV